MFGLSSVNLIYALPSRDNDRLCIIEIAVANGTANRQQKYMDEPVSEVVFGPTFLGGVPSLFELHHNSGNVSGFIGCIRELQMGSKELYVVGEAIRGQNIQNCDTAVCQHQPCRNGGTCISLETAFCLADHVLDYSSTSIGTQRTLWDSPSDSCEAVFLKDYRQLVLNLNLNTSNTEIIFCPPPPGNGWSMRRAGANSCTSAVHFIPVKRHHSPRCRAEH
ncbi:hypothetical protein H4Q32_009462 [Labeo rohita]|uniref:Laminin G domain-containing protein n=1 Tax=Labeo rohita TaxID=84645 RepID=A0ABQ8M529_LABRO|nr:hypothetical protein H4Q32_009462 [Labeo rohita]